MEPMIFWGSNEPGAAVAYVPMRLDPDGGLVRVSFLIRHCMQEKTGARQCYRNRHAELIQQCGFATAGVNSGC